MKKLIVVSAPSGAGKTTLCKKLLRDFPELMLSISSTTRAPRGQEKEGKDYFFLTKEGFEAKIQEGLFAEWALVHGNYYGTSKEAIRSAFAQDRSVLLDIDVQGAESLRVAFPQEAFTLFIAPPSLQELEQRLRARGTDKEEVILKRIRNAEIEMKDAPKFHHTILNDDLERAYRELHGLITNQLRPGGPRNG